MSRKPPRYLPYLMRSPDGSGWNWAIEDTRTGLTMRSGWLAGVKREAQAEIRYWVSKYEGGAA